MERFIRKQIRSKIMSYVSDRQLQMMAIKRENIRLHRAGTKSFYWDTVTGIKLRKNEINIIFYEEHFFVPEEQYVK